MRKVLALVGLIAAFAIPAAAFGVDLQPSQVGTGCDGDGTYHFVAQGSTESTVLEVDFSDGSSFSGTPDKVTPGGTAHWTIDAGGTIDSASADPARKLVLSDVDCGEKKEEDPKK